MDGGGGMDAIWEFIKNLGGGSMQQPGSVQQPGGAGAAATALAPGAQGAFPPPGGQQPPPPQPGQMPQGTSPGGMPGMQMPPTSFLDNPALQGLLAGYLNYIKSPRAQGVGGALGSAGIGALGQYEEARRQQYLPQMLAAQLGVQQSEIGKNIAATKFDEMRTGAPQRILTANRGLRDQLLPYAKTLQDPQEQTLFTAFADSIGQDSTKTWGFDEAMKAGADQARTGAEQARKKLLEFQGPQGALGKADVSSKEAAAAASKAEAALHQKELEKVPYEIRGLIDENQLKQADIIKTNLQGAESIATRKSKVQEIKASIGDQFDKRYPPAAKMVPGYGYAARRTAAINQGMVALNLTDDGTILDKNKEQVPGMGAGAAPKLSEAQFDQKIADARRRDPNATARLQPDGSYVITVNGKDEPLE